VAGNCWRPPDLRFAIVHNALTSSPRLTIFEYAPAPDTWICDTGAKLAFEGDDRSHRGVLTLSVFKAASMANHASTRTTQLYDRRREEMTLDEVERIRV
jgi:hypothetical protein